MRTYRNANGKVVAPTYEKWASYDLGMGLTAVVLAITIRTMQYRLGLNDWQTREVVRKWAEESARKKGGGSREG